MFYLWCISNYCCLYTAFVEVIDEYSTHHWDQFATVERIAETTLVTRLATNTTKEEGI